MTQTFRSFAAIVFAAVVLLISASAGHAEKIFHRGNGAEPYSLDPHRAISVAENNIIGDLLLGLYTEDAKGEPIFGAAESAETAPDGLSWTFKIRAHDWSDGTPVTAGDFVFALRRVLDPETAAEYASVLYPIKNALKVNKGQAPIEQLGVRAPDAHTLVIELENPAPFLPELLTHYTTYPLPRHVVDKFGSDWSRPGKMVSNGPYVLSEWRPHDHVRLSKNTKFYDAANVKIDEVYYYPTDDDLSALKRYRAGELDMQERWPVSEYKWLAANIPSETRKHTYLAIRYTSFNMTKKPFDDIRVRKALAMAIDRDVIAQDIYGGVYGDVANSFVPPGMRNAEHTPTTPWSGMTMEQRRTEAKRLLAEAGFGPGHPLKFTYSYISNPDIKRSAVAMQDMWRQIGAEAELSNTESKVHWNLLEVRSFEVAHNTWVFDYSDAKNFFFQFESAAVEMNNSAYDSETFDDIMRRVDTEKDVAARAKLLGEADATMMADLPAVPEFFPYARHLVKSYVLNWENNPRDTNRTRWLDLGNKPAPGTAANDLPSSSAATEGDFWSWLASWFSTEAWSKWWNG